MPSEATIVAAASTSSVPNMSAIQQVLADLGAIEPSQCLRICNTLTLGDTHVDYPVPMKLALAA